MRTRVARARFCAAATALAAAVAAPAARAQVQPAGTNDFGGFRNVLAVGQGETVNAAEFGAFQASGNPPPTFVNQRSLYTSLPGTAPDVTGDNIGSFFKPAGFGVAPGEVDPTRTTIPRPGVTIIRDRTYQVPHVYGATRSDTMFGAGYASAEDRLFLMDALRHMGRARLSELTGPSAIPDDAETLKSIDYSEEELQQQIDDAAADYGAEGEQVRQDLLDYTDGINAYIRLARADATKLPVEYPALGKVPEDWKPTDTVAVAALIGGIFGYGGGQEVNNADILQRAVNRFGKQEGRQVFDDFARAEDPEAPVTVKKRFGYPGDPQVQPDRDGVALTDFKSFDARDPAEGQETSASSAQDPGTALGRRLQEGLRATQRRLASNATLVSRQQSASNRPVAVTGPQVGYYSPEILFELDLHGPGVDARGAAFPGVSLYVLLGRGQDFSWTATTATSDNVDLFAERLCEPDGSKPSRSSDYYVYKGKCIPFLQRDHVLSITPNPSETDPTTETVTLEVKRSVHGPIQGTATVDGKPVAIAKARTTYKREVDSALAFERLNTNQVRDAKSFIRVMSQINFVFNWFYNDDRDIAYVTSGWFPRRAQGTDLHLPTWGTGKWDWRRFDPDTFQSKRLGRDALPRDVNPPQGYIVNWNNKQAPGWHAADDVFAFGSVHRSERLEDRVKRGIAGDKTLSLPELVGVMGDAATVDLRGQEVYPVLRRVIGEPDDKDVRRALRVLDEWVADGAHRRDRDFDGFYEDPKAILIMDAWWNRLVRKVFSPVLGDSLLEAIRTQMAFDQPPGPGGSSYFSGWWGYLDKDLRTLLKPDKVRGRFSRRYCGEGDLDKCRSILVSTLKDAVKEVEDEQGDDPKIQAVCGDEDIEGQPCDEIEFSSAGAVGTDPIPWQDRGTFQQAVEVQGHRPR